MKLIIDVPEVDYECAKHRWVTGVVCEMDYNISKGIPFDDVTKVMQKRMDNLHIETRPISPEQETKILFYNMAVDDCLKVVRAYLENVRK